MIGLAVFLALVLAQPASAQIVNVPRGPEPALTIIGEIDRSDYRTYLEHAFELPEGVSSLRIRVDHTGQLERTNLDVGLIDPNGWRGWSGGGRAQIDLTALSATPGYLAGPLVPGEWTVVLGVPNIREGATADYRIEIWFDLGRPDGPAGLEPGWLRGDFHVHSAHNDATCASKSGARVRCPLHLTFDAALEANLDFVVLTDHNTVSAQNALGVLQPYYDTLLIIPGVEVTTFYGHANLIGATAYPDFRLDGSAQAFSAFLDSVEAQDAILSPNHPRLRLGEGCLGCAWEMEVADYSRIAAVEAVGGGILDYFKSTDNPFTGLRFLDARLNEGLRMTGIGGSDNHDPTPGSDQPPLGRPTTVVFAQEASIDGVIEAVRAGRAFIDVAMLPGRIFTIHANAAGLTAGMGGSISAPAGAAGRITARLEGAGDETAGARVRFIGPPGRLGEAGLTDLGEGVFEAVLDFAPGEAPAWVRAELRGADGKAMLLTNAVYLDGR